MPARWCRLPGVATTSQVGLIGGLLVAMWNYMGWDNASTIAAEVEKPQRTYPRAMMGAVILVAAPYILPVAAMALTRLDSSAWETGSWADIADMLGGPLAARWLVLGGMISAFGMFNALVMSYSRLPYAMAFDGMLPKCSRSPRAQPGAVGLDSRARDGMGAVPWIRHSNGWSRLTSSSRRRACCWNSWRWWCFASPSQSSTTLPRAWRRHWSRDGRRAAHGAAGVRHRPQ